MYEWPDLLAFLQAWMKRSEQRNDPLFMQAALKAAYLVLIACWVFEKQLENPKALAIRVCPWCKNDFRPQVAWQSACGKCDEIDQEYPPLNVESIVEAALRELQALDNAEKVQP